MNDTALLSLEKDIDLVNQILLENVQHPPNECYSNSLTFTKDNFKNLSGTR